MPDIFVSRKTVRNEPEVQKEVAHSRNPVRFFSTFVENPSGVSFHHKEPDEEIILFLRSHLITNAKWIAIMVIFAILPTVFLFVGDTLPFPPIDSKFTFMLVLLYYLGLFGFAISSFLTWYFNIFIITKKRVVDIDFAGLIFHDVAETQFSLIQDVNYTQSGAIRHLLNYGDVFAQTAGGKENLEALGVPSPSKVTHFITRYIGVERKSKNV